ncbi:uncharacterized protein BJ171DRAFT_505959 [Polychytrium aggregatum]|uniref:uncharacterized protein n=1 Tax=Polychytrium aggregatum TaxID=110093 RepID=UPI0022FEC659|nr:uncharacterized protein BJ171DRAFT_505959 [Polychytrium aggregatum]KAI9204498.1 hypothetical protein BJ171DRAFT_505959 [Polychytrium aggregatum]
MWKKKEIKNISASSVVDLKAELFRAQAQFDQEKAQSLELDPLGSVPRKKIERPATKKPGDKSNRGVEARSQKDKAALALTENEAQLLQRSQASLEVKSKIYDLIRSGAADDLDHVMDSEDMLIDFVRKNWDDPVSESSDSTEEVAVRSGLIKDPWIEVIDEFGRNRVVRRSEARKEGMRPVVEGAFDDGDDEMPDTESRESKQAELERLMRTDDPLRYDASNEVRNLGVSFYQFSKSEVQRHRQMEALKQLREETIQRRRQVAQDSRRLGDLLKRRMDERRRFLREKRGQATTAASAGEGEADNHDPAEILTEPGPSRGGDIPGFKVNEFLEGMRREFEARHAM